MADHGCFSDGSWNRDIIVCSYQLPCCLRLPLAKNTMKSPPHRPCLAQGILQLISNHATSDPWKGVHIPASLVKWWNICGPTCPCCLLLRFKLFTSRWQNQKGRAMPHSPKVRKDGPASVEFYTKHMGMTLLAQKDFPQWKFSLQRDFKNSLG